MAISDYKPNKPQATDKLSVSQLDIYTNFGSLNDWISVNHETYNSTLGAGFHKFVTFTLQTVVPAINSDQMLLFQKQAAAPFPLTGNEMFFKRSTVADSEIPVSAKENDLSLASSIGPATVVNAGWTYLFSGILLKWGRLNAGSNNNVTVDLNQSGYGPNFTSVEIVSGSLISENNTTNSLQTSFSSFTMTFSKTGGGSYTYIALGV